MTTTQKGRRAAAARWRISGSEEGRRACAPDNRVDALRNGAQVSLGGPVAVPPQASLDECAVQFVFSEKKSNGCKGGVGGANTGRCGNVRAALAGGAGLGVGWEDEVDTKHTDRWI